MAKAQFKGELSNGKTGIIVSLTIYTWVDDKVYFAYSPALNLTGYGNTEVEANESFKIVLREYVNYTAKKKTLFEDLEQHGWLINRRRKKLHAPDFEDMLRENEDFKNIISNKAPKSETREVELSFA